MLRSQIPADCERDARPAGHADKNVVFTSAYDDEYGGDSNNDGTATTPSHYDWGYIQINNSTTKLTTA